jgi:hypothetical protein
VLKRFKLLQAAHVGFCRGVIRDGLRIGTGLLVGFLLRDRISLAKIDPAFRR